MNTIKSFRDLEVYRKSYDLSLEIHKLSLEFPKVEKYVLGNQIRRCSKSICSNLAEGYGKQSQSKAEFKRYIQICIGSANEMLVWLDYCRDLEYMRVELNSRLLRDYEEVIKMLHGLHRVWI